MSNLPTSFVAALALLVTGWVGVAGAAQVSPSGYTNDFSLQPPATDWATGGGAGGATDNYVLDTDVNTSVTAAGTTTQLAAATGAPPAAGANAVWHSTSFYLQTRPTQNRYTVLMGKFVNNTGTNATELRLAYQMTSPGGGVGEEAEKGTRAYYSLTGLAGSWTNLVALNNTVSAAGTFAVVTNLALNWPTGATLYLLWADDNATGNPTDSGNQFDNFSLTVTAGVPPITDLTLFLTAPTNNALYVSGTPVAAAAAVLNGTAPHTVEYFVSSGAGYSSGGSSATPPFNVNLGALAAGQYRIYATVSDSAGVPLSTNSFTNSFVVADPISATLASPANGATFDNLTPVTGAVTASGGREPYTVQFRLDGSPSGPPISAPPYQRDFGALPVGDHTLAALVTDASGWSSNTPVHTVHITGPLAVTLTPTNDTVYAYGQPVILTAVGGGGTAPYSVTFHVNGEALASIATPPFTTNLGLLNPGTYSLRARITDSATPAPQQADSTTNTLTILPNPLGVTLANPTNGQNAVSGQPFALAATVAVNTPVTPASVEFFFNGASVGTDSSAPFGATVPGPAPGAYPVYAIATDTLGRTAVTTTNLVTFVIDPLANNHFTNRFTLTTPASVSANNTGATTETGEPVNQQFNTWGTTLWWKWVAPASGSVTIDTFGSTFDTLLSIYTGSAVNGLTLVVRNNNAPGVANVSLATFNATQGTEYQIQVGGVTPFGGQAASGAIQLNLAMPPSVAITNPVNGTVFPAGSNFLVQATATAPAGSITKVDLYLRGILAGTASEPPFAFTVSGAPSGSNALFAVATDTLGQSATSAVVNVLVADPGITLIAPADGTVFLATNPITASVYPFLPGGGTITNVDFFVDGQWIARDATAPFTGTWTNVVGGSHRFTASALDDVGGSHLAAPVYAVVAQALVPSNSVWRYLSDGSNQGTTWRAPAFDDGDWSSGPAELGYGDGDEQTQIPSGPTGAFFVTYYFRHTFTTAGLAGLTNLLLSIEYDDAAAVYLNGQEVFRTANLPANAAFDTLATGAAVEDTTVSVALGLTSLLAGPNVLAVEVHQQALNSSDVSFNLRLLGIPTLVRNQSPLVAITNPAPDAHFLAPPSIAIDADASDTDSGVARVEFLVNGLKIGEDTTAPYSVTWNNPPVAAHVLTAVATDLGGAVTVSDPVSIVVHDAAGRPVSAVTSPQDGVVMEGPTNLFVTATAQAITSVTNVEFLANGVVFGSDATPPYGANWTAPFGTNVLTTVAYDAGGVTGTSPPVTVVITIPPTNVIPPRIFTQVPLAESTVTNLTNITVVFTERVQNVDAADLLIDGRPASAVTGSGSNYTFHFPQPAYGVVDVAFANGHGITDFGYPANLPFDEQGGGNLWSLLLIDRTPPTLVGRNPAPNTTVTNFTQLSVTFSEPVAGVDATDLLINGSPAFGLTGGGTNYTFLVSQPPSGTVSVSWAANHGITDLSEATNAFNRNGAGATWVFTLDARTVLVQSNSAWRFVKGTNEASQPADAWRQPGFNDAAWTVSSAPFVFGEINFTNANNPGTDLGDMANNAYSSVYLRTTFVVPNVGSVTNLLLNHQSDDGFIAWINGVEVFRYNVPAGEAPYNGGASAQAPEAGNAGAAYIVATLTNAVPALVAGTNFLAVHAFNVITNPASSDFAFNAQLYTFLTDAALTSPRLAQATPAPGDILAFTNLTVVFSEGVTNVNASDLLVNGMPATAVDSVTNTTWTFRFAQPPFGPVTVSWDTNHGIVDFDNPPKPFDSQAAGATLNYTLINPSNPRVLVQVPTAGATVTGLTAIVVTFTEPVAGVDAADLLVGGAPALGVSSTGETNFTFTIAQPAYGSVTVRWAAGHGIVDTEAGNPFDPTRFGGQWNYTLVNPIPTVTLTSPTNGAYALAPANIPVRATATDNDGTIVRVEFFEGTTSLAVLSNAPYALTRSNAAEGVYTFQAVATDNTGISVTSAPVSLNVVTTLPAFLTRGPYLQAGSPTRAVVRWRTDLATDGVVYFGTNPAALTNTAVETQSTNEHIVAITGLQPDTRYFYSIGSTGQRLAGTNGPGSEYWFDTHPVPGTQRPTRIWVLGDAGTAGNGNADRQSSTRDAFYNYAATNGGLPQLWLMLGDNAYNVGSDTEHQRAVFDMYPSLLRNRFMWPTIGNHETSQSTTATDFPYLHIFSLPTAGESGGVPSGTEKYYSFDYGNIHFVCLDSMTSGRTGTTPMAQWLQDDLAATSAEWIIVFFHHPPYTKGSHDSDAETDLIQIRQNLVPILEANGVDLVLSGHSHCYERSYLLHGHYGLSSTITPSMKVNGGDGRTDGTGAYRKNAAGEGVVYTVTGSAGQATFGSLNHPAHFSSFLLLGSMVIDVSSNRLDAIFLDTAGAALDRFTLLKPVPGSPAVPLNLTARFTNHAAIRLDWTNAATNEQAYVVERSLDGTNFTTLLTLPADAVSALDTLVSPNTTYTYRVRATNSVAFSEYSNLASATTTNTPPLAVPDAFYRFTGQNLSIPVASLLANDSDADGDAVTLDSVSATSAQGGTVSRVGQNVLYVPANGFNGPDSFSYTIADGQGGLGSALVNILVSSNTPPQLAPVPDWIANVLQSLLLTNSVADADQPTNRFTFALEPGAPEGARVHPTTGRFHWTPTRAQANTTNLITIRVTDDGAPPLGSTTSFTVIVRDFVELTAGEAVLRAGDTSSVPVEVTASAGLSALQVALRFTDGRLTNFTLEPVAAAVTGSSFTSTGPGAGQLSFTANPAAPIQGTLTLGRLHFLAPAGARSAFIPLELHSPAYTRATEGLQPSALLHPGRATLIEAEPLVEAAVATNGLRQITLYGRVGVRYTLETSAGVTPPSWVPWTEVTLTNLYQPLTLTNPPTPSVFIRARE